MRVLQPPSLSINVMGELAKLISKLVSLVKSEAKRRGVGVSRVRNHRHWCTGADQAVMFLGVSENRLKTPKPNGFADHYPYEKWLFHWDYTLFSDIKWLFYWEY